MRKVKTKLTQRKRYNFFRDAVYHTSAFKLSFILIVLWLIFSYALYWSEQGAEDTSITTFGWALYWGIAAFSTAGVADMPVRPLSGTIGAIWVVVGSIIYFGAIVSIVTSYILRPINTPTSNLVSTIEYNLERLDDLSPEELDMLRESVDTLVEHMEALKGKQQHNHSQTE